MLETEWTPGQLRDAGMAKSEQAADPRVIVIIDALIEAANGSRKPWSANDIRQAMPTTQSRGLVGARVNAAAMRRPRVMVKVGEEPSDLNSTHGKKIAVWVGVQ